MGCIWKRGKTYWIKYRRGGKSHYESARTSNHDEAKKLLATREAAVAKGVPVSPKIGSMRWEEAIADLVNEHKGNGTDTTKLEARIENHLTPVFGKRRMADLTRSDFKAYQAHRRAEGASNGTINRELALVRRAFTLAKDAGKLLYKPKVPMLKEAAARAGFFDDDQIAAVIGHLPPHLQPLVRFGYVTGWRLSECLNLQWKNVELKGGEVRLNAGETKNDEGRVFRFTAELKLMFTELHKKRDGLRCAYVFHHDHKRIKQIRKRWATACKKAGVPGRRFHDLRRSAARNFVRAGIPERVAMQMIGHKTRSIFDRYNIVSEGDLADAAKKLDAVTTSVTTAGDKTAK